MTCGTGSTVPIPPSPALLCLPARPTTPTFRSWALWLDDADLRYTPPVNFVGPSRYNHQFDFVVPKSKRAPERILRVINNPNKDNAQSAAFAWVDTKDVRPSDSLAFAVLIDCDRTVMIGRANV